MPLCVRCNREVCVPCVRAKIGETSRRKIVVATDDELLAKPYFRRMAVASSALSKERSLSRREFPNWMADAIYSYEGEIVWPHGGAFTVLDTAIDLAFNDDGSFRWLSAFLTFAEEEPKQSPQYRIVPRLRLIDLAFKIDRPDVARHFAR